MDAVYPHRQSQPDESRAGRVNDAPRTNEVGCCPCCASTTATFLLRDTDRLLGVPGAFTYRKCGKCATVYQDPRVIPEDLSLCYPAAYVTHEPPIPPPPGTPFPRAREALRNAVIAAAAGKRQPGVFGLAGSLLARSRSLRNRASYYDVVSELEGQPTGRGRALDIGCGAGSLMLALHDAGWDVAGVEWDPAAAEVARAVTGRPVTVGDFKDANLQLQHYDLVVLKHVFEHLADPSAGLQRIGALLAPGGRAVLIYPNPTSLAARLYNEDWVGWDPPRHLAFPSRSAIAAASGDAGLILKRFRTSARHTSNLLSHSRARRAGLPESKSPPGWWDRVLGAGTTILTRCGIPLGEENVVVLVKKS